MICPRVEPTERISSTRSSSLRLSPSTMLMVMGKKAITTMSTSLGVML